MDPMVKQMQDWRDAQREHVDALRAIAFAWHHRNERLVTIGDLEIAARDDLPLADALAEEQHAAQKLGAIEDRLVAEHLLGEDKRTIQCAESGERFVVLAN